MSPAGEMAGGEEDFGSLFEGMVVLGDNLTSTSDHFDDRLSQPLDENLFSDLTITSPDQPLPFPFPFSSPSPSLSPAVAPPFRPGTRRRKRGTVRVGYARSFDGGGVRHDDDAREDGVSASLSRSSTFDGESAAADEVLDYDERHDQDPKNHPLIADSNPDHAGGISQLPPPIEDQMDQKYNLDRIEKSNVEGETDEKSNLAPDTNQQVDDSRIEKSNLVDTGRIEKSIVVLESHGGGGGKESPSFSVEERLVLIHESICRKREEILGTAASVSSARKEAARRRRKALEDVNSATEKFKGLERELEEACEAEDFERAEKVSESLLEVEQEKLGFLGAHKDAEKKCDSIDLDMQRVLEMQIETEVGSAAMLEAFAKDAADTADVISSKAYELSSKDSEAWMLSAESLEWRKMELDIESYFIREADLKMKEIMEASVEDDRKMKDALTERRDMLSVELEKLLVLVRQKEAEIVENDCMIEEVEKRILAVINGSQEAQSVIDKKHDELQSQLSQIELETEALFLMKRNYEELFFSEEEKKLKLNELASMVMAEAKAYFQYAELRKCLSASILKTREDKIQLAESVEKMTEEVQLIRQKVSAARATLQDLSLKRASMQQEIASAKQRMNFLGKRGPEVEIEKRVASAARNFKEAAKLAAEAKALSIEKENIQNKLDMTISEIKKIEDDKECIVNEIGKNEELILFKEKEAAQTRFEMLYLIAAATRAEESAALELYEVEEAAILHTEVEAAESEAAKLQEAYGFENLEEKTEKAIGHVPMALVVNHAGEKLVEIAGSVMR